MTNEPSLARHRHALPIGYRVAECRIVSVLGHGGFGITYLARDEALQQDVAIKEYLPREVATRAEGLTVTPISSDDETLYAWGLGRFVDEARMLARFRHPNIIAVRQFLRANGTAYLIMDYCEGESLDQRLTRDTTLPPDCVEALLPPLLDALLTLHSAGVTHRDIKPGNIYLRADGSPLLLDFGAARQALAQHSRSLTVMATPGYAALEQYSAKGKQGPWTDIYGLGATLYRCVTGSRPPDATDRLVDDELELAVSAAPDYPRSLLEQIDAALRLKPSERPQSIAEWREIGASVISPPLTQAVDEATDHWHERADSPIVMQWDVHADVAAEVQRGGAHALSPSDARFLLRTTLIVMAVAMVLVMVIYQTRPVAPDAATSASIPIATTPDGADTRPSPPLVATEHRDSPPPAETKPASGTKRVDLMLSGNVGPHLVFVRGGEYVMGSEPQVSGLRVNERQHRVTVDDLWIGQHPVTVGEFVRFFRATGYQTDAERHADGYAGCWTLEEGVGRFRRDRNWHNPGFPQTDAHPVVCLSWNDAQAYAQWISNETGERYRLLTEAEWEHAARAGTTTARYWGDDADQACRFANVADRTIARANPGWTVHACDDGYLYTSPVGSFLPNAWSLHDMLGNVSEWTCSVFDGAYVGAENRCDDQGNDRVLRGGSWKSPPGGVRSAVRDWSPPGERHFTLGFRLARSP